MVPKHTIYCLGEVLLALDADAVLAHAETFGLASAGMPPCWHRPVPRRAGARLFWPSWERTHSGSGPPPRLPPRAWIPHTRPFPAHCPPLCCLRPAARRSLTACAPPGCSLPRSSWSRGSSSPRDALLFASSGLCDSPLRYTHLAALTAARDAGALTCFVPLPGLPSGPSRTGNSPAGGHPAAAPRADIVLFSPRKSWFFVRHGGDAGGAVFPLLRGHTQLVLLARAEGIHAFTRTNHAFWPGLSLPAPRLAAKALCCLLQKTARRKNCPASPPGSYKRSITNAQSPRRPAGALLRKVSNSEKIVGCLVSG